MLILFNRRFLIKQYSLSKHFKKCKCNILLSATRCHTSGKENNNSDHFLSQTSCSLVIFHLANQPSVFTLKGCEFWLQNKQSNYGTILNAIDTSSNTNLSACETKLPLSHSWPDMLTALIRDMVTALQLLYQNKHRTVSHKLAIDVKLEEVLQTNYATWPIIQISNHSNVSVIVSLI